VVELKSEEREMTFENLEVCQIGRECMCDISNSTKGFLKKEQYRLVVQMSKTLYS